MYSKFARHLIYPIYQFYTHRNVLKNLHQLDQTQWLTLNEIKKLQWIKLKKILVYAYENTLYYRQVFKKLNINPKTITNPNELRKLPLLEKQDIIDNIDNIISSKYEKKELIKDSTGGSIGLNLNFLYDNNSVGHRLSVAYRSNYWAGLDIFDKYAQLWGSPFDISLRNTSKGKLTNMLFRSLFLSADNLSEENMYIYSKRLLLYKPKVIIGYPSSLYFFVKFLDKNKIEGIKPISVISSAEVLYDYQRKLIESVFRCKVFNRYGCREFSTIAQECSEHSGLHINAEHVYVECLKENGECASFGERGELVITDLDNYAMPFIRYKIGDIAILKDKKCKCGRGLPMLERIEGRTFDIVVGSNGRHLGGTFWTLILRTSVDGIKQFQVFQESKEKITIKIVTDELFKTKYLEALRDIIQGYCGEDTQINFKIVDNIPLTKSGKFRFIISKVTPFEN